MTPLSTKTLAQYNHWLKPKAKETAKAKGIRYTYGMIIKYRDGRPALWQTRQGKERNGFICWAD